MANSAVDSPRPPARASRRFGGWLPGETSVSAPLGATLALTVVLGTAGFLFLMSAVWVVHPPAKLPGFLAAGGDQNQHTKTALYLCGYGLILPLALLIAIRAADVIAAGPNGRALDSLAALLVGTLATALLLVRLSSVVHGGGGTKVLLPVVTIWGAATLLTLARAASTRPWDPLLRLAGASTGLAYAAGALVLGAILCATALKSISIIGLVVAAAVAAAGAYVFQRARLPRLGGRRGVAFDVIAGILLVLAVPNLLIFTTGNFIPTWLTRTGITQFHQDFLLGPANQVLHGGTLLAGSPVSQYGVGSIYFLAGWFHLAPIGYGTYGFLDGLLTALYYLAAFAIVRIAGVRRPLAVAAFVLALIALVYNLEFPPGAIPQQGPIRFGMPMLLVLASVIAVGWPRHERLVRGAGLLVVGIASIWALEAFVYTVFTYAAIACVESALMPVGERLRTLVRRALYGLGAIVVVQIVFALATVAASGKFPDWAQYASFLHAFLFGGVAGSITYGFTRWSPGVAVAGLYFASAAALALLVLRRPDAARRDRVLIVALTGVTAYGIALYSYFDNRSVTYLLLYVSLPALLTATLWLSFLLRRSSGVGSPVRTGALAFALCLAVLLVATGWSSIGGRFARTPLAEAFPGGHGLRADIRRLWHPPPIDPRAPDGEALLARFMPGQSLVLVVVSPDLGTEILMRSKRGNLLPIGDPIEESFVIQRRLPDLRKGLSKVHAGQRVLMDAGTWAVLQSIRAHPGVDALKQYFGTSDTSIEAWVLQQLDNRFHIRPIQIDRSGFVVAQLDPRS
jgi:hypothetical protein